MIRFYPNLNGKGCEGSEQDWGFGCVVGVNSEIRSWKM